MSTILEALKKSEQERKLNNVPTLSNMSAPREKSRWPMVGFIVLAVLLLAILFFVVSNWLAGRGLFALNSPTGAASEAPILVSNETVGVAPTAPPSAASDEILVNVVSYAEQADQRFVMINGKLFREGEFVRAGLRVEKIKLDEVVLNLRGRRIVRKP